MDGMDDFDVMAWYGMYIVGIFFFFFFFFSPSPPPPPPFFFSSFFFLSPFLVFYFSLFFLFFLFFFTFLPLFSILFSPHSSFRVLTGTPECQHYNRPQVQ
jgi:hypothetical protein